MKIETRNKLPSDPASRLRMTIIEEARKRQLERLLPRSTNIPQRQPSPVVPDKLESKIENITKEEAKILINDYSPKVLLRWQQSIVEKSSLKTVIEDRSLFFKLRAQFFRLNNRMPELKDLIEMSDQTLEEMMGGSKKKEEMTVIRQSMIQHNVLPSNSQIVFQIDLLGLPEETRERLAGYNIKTIESICQIVGKELESDEKTLSINRFNKNQLLKFIQELAEQEKRSSSPEGLPTNLKQPKSPIIEKKQRQIVEKPKRPKGKKQAILEQYGLIDDRGNIIESWPALLLRLCEDVPLHEVAALLKISLTTLDRWREKAGLPKRSTMETRRITRRIVSLKLSPEEKLEIKRQKIVRKLSEVDEIKADPIGYLKQRLEDGTAAVNLFSDLRKKGLKIKNIGIFYKWLKILDIPIQKKSVQTQISERAHIYEQAKETGQLERLTSNQLTSLQMAIDQGLSIDEVASSLSLERGKTISYRQAVQFILGGLNVLERKKDYPLRKTRKQTILEQYGLKDENGNIIEPWRDFLIRICKDRLLKEVAVSLKVSGVTLSKWRSEENLPKHSIKITRKRTREVITHKLSPEEKQELKRQKIISSLSNIKEMTGDEIGYIKQKLEDRVAVKDLFNDLRGKGLEIKSIITFYQWLKDLGIPIQQAQSKSEEKKELTGSAYLQVMFPGRLGTITYNTLKRNNINTLEELKNILPNVRILTGIGSKGTQAYVDLLKHFFPDDEFVNPLLVKKPRIIQEKPRKTIEKPKKIAKKGSIYQEGADLYREAKQSGLLTRLVENQQVTLELVFGQGLTLSQTASRLSAKKNKNISSAAIRMYVVGALDRLKKLKSSPTDLAYLQAMFPNRFGTIIYETLRKKNINTPEELKSFLAKGDDFTGIGIKGIQMCVEVLKHFFPDEELELIKLAYQRMLSMSFGKQAGH